MLLCLYFLYQVRHLVLNIYFCVPLLSGSFPVLKFSTIYLEETLAELSDQLQRLRMEGEYKMFIDSLSERNKSKNAIKGFHPCIKISLFKENYSLFKRTCYLILLLLMNTSTLYSIHLFSRETIPE